MDSRHGFLTANDVTPYVFAGVPLNGKPMVVEVPAVGDKAQLFGTIINAWQRPISSLVNPERSWPNSKATRPPSASSC